MDQVDSRPAPRADVKLADVARTAGVSPATVSRVLNGDERVGAEHRERVMAAITELDYRPNRLASNLRRRKTQMIGVVVADIENPHYTEMLRAVEDAASQRGYRIVVCSTDEKAEKQRTYLELLAAERVAGAIVAPSEPEAAEIAELLDLGTAVVAFDRPVADARADLVVTNNQQATRRATEHLLSAGHRGIGLVGGPEQTWTGAERLAGYREAMLAAGAEPLVEQGRFRVDGGREATIRLLDGPSDLSALVFANNLMSMGGLAALRDRRVAVPGDVALVAVDDPFWAAIVDPPLTTLAQPVRKMAIAAVDLLFERIEGTRDEPRAMSFDLELNVRGSCGVRRTED